MLRDLWICLGCILALMLCASGAAAQESVPRLALVVGNAAYADAPLPTAANDAGLIARMLSQTGFAVTAAGDVDRARLDAVFDDFAARVKVAGPSTIVFVYLAGHGLQFSGDNYFVPVGAKLARDIDVPGAAVSVSAFRRRLEALPAKARVLVYDLARDGPFALDGTRLAGGLALIQPGAGTLLAFNAAPGTVAMPDVAPYGFYARALAEMIATPGLGFPSLFERVRLRVSNMTAGVTSPWNSGTIAEDVTLASAAPALRTSGADTRPSDATASDQAYVAAVARDTLDGYDAFLKTYPADPLAARVRAIVAVRREALLWNETLRLDSDRSFWTYMRRYPRGPHIPDARRRLVALRAPLDPPPRFDIVTYTSAAVPSATELPLVDRPIVALADAAWPSIPATADMLPPPPSAFYDELPPPPIVTDGVLPIADPIAGARAESVAITQPNVPSGAPIVADTSFLPNGDWIVASFADGKAVGRLVMTQGSNADRIIVQTGPEGAVVARTTVVHDKGGTKIIQTGPSGGILTKSVTRADPGGGQTTVSTTGGNQMIATLRVDRQGLTSVTRGPAGLLAPRRPASPPRAEMPADPPAPPPLTMPMSSLPAAPPASPAMADKAPVAKATDKRGPDVKQPDARGADAKGPDTPRAPDPSPSELTAPEIVPPDPAAHLPLVAPLPPRRAVPPTRPEPAKTIAPFRKGASGSRAKASVTKR